MVATSEDRRQQHRLFVHLQYRSPTPAPAVGQPPAKCSHCEVPRPPVTHDPCETHTSPSTSLSLPLVLVSFALVLVSFAASGPSLSAQAVPPCPGSTGMSQGGACHGGGGSEREVGEGRGRICEVGGPASHILLSHLSMAVVEFRTEISRSEIMSGIDDPDVIRRIENDCVYRTLIESFVEEEDSYDLDAILRATRAQRREQAQPWQQQQQREEAIAAAAAGGFGFFEDAVEEASRDFTDKWASSSEGEESELEELLKSEDLGRGGRSSAPGRETPGEALLRAFGPNDVSVSGRMTDVQLAAIRAYSQGWENILVISPAGSGKSKIAQVCWHGQVWPVHDCERGTALIASCYMVIAGHSSDPSRGSEGPAHHRRRARGE